MPRGKGRDRSRRDRFRSDCSGLVGATSQPALHQTSPLAFEVVPGG